MKVILDDLPPTEDKDFWAEADVHTNLRPVPFFDQAHVLVRRTGHQAQCTHCSWGFQLDMGDKVIDGHLFNKKGEKVI